MGSTPRIGRIAMWVALLASTAPAATVAGQAAPAPDLREIFPYMMLVIDTSGSMERLPSCTCEDLACLNCLPVCNPSSGSPQKNRWAVTLEALTGTFNNFSCERLDRTTQNGATYDAAYYMPYHQPWDCAGQSANTDCAFYTNVANPPTVPVAISTRNQNANGILDEYKGRVNFGLMTFDGYATYLGAPQLQPVAAFDEDLSEAVQGLWSYGGPKSFHYPNCTTDYMMDTGARSSVAIEGSLVSLNSCRGTPGSPTCPSWCTACWNSDPSEITNQLNEDIQEALLATRPYGGTPIAASLEDLYFHFQEIDQTDAFGGCRKRFALLMTDGEPDKDYRNLGCDCDQGSDPLRCGPPPNDPAQMHCPYDKAEDIAFDLVHGRGSGDPAKIERLFVIGLAVESPTTEQSLDAIARAGCTLGPDCVDPDTEHEALFAVDLESLVAGLQEKILDALEPISRSVPVFANTTSTTTKQYQISTGFEVPVGKDAPWTGIIERTRFTCNGTTAEQEALVQSDLLHERIHDQADPVLKTVVPDSSANGHVFGSSGGTPCGVPQGTDPTGCELVDLDHSSVTTDVLDLGAPTAETLADRDELLDWMFGEPGSLRAGKKLGDIYHSSPVIQGRPQIDSVDEAFNAFRVQDKVRNRPITMFVNTNDGMLRAIALETAPAPTDSAVYLTDTTAGDQFWAFVPPLLLDDLKDNLTGHRMTMDGTPVIKDVYLNRVRGQRASLAKDQFHSVLITGMRGGGEGETNAYIALDVTNPTDPRFLWQFSDPDDPADPWDSVMGKSYGQPAIVQANYMFDPTGGTNYQAKNGAVAILPGGVGLQGASGWSNDCDTATQTRPSARNSLGDEFFTFEGLPGGVSPVDPARHRVEVRCWRNPGRALYFVDVETGRLIKKIHNNGANTLPLFPSPLVSTPAVFPGDPGTTASKAFITDADGVIWRIDMSALDPAPTSPTTGWTARPFHDVFWDRGPAQGEVSYEAPILTVDEQSRLVVIVGTGDTDNFNKVSVENRVVSLTEVRDTTSGVPATELYKAAFNWEKRVKPTNGLVASELVTGSMALFGGQLYFGTFIAVSGSNACDAGKGRVFAVDYLARDPGDANPAIGQVQTYGPLPVPNPSFDAQSDAVSVVNVSAANAVTDLFIQGLGVTQGPTCSSIDTTSFDVFSQDLPAIQTPQQPALFLVAQGRGPVNIVSPSGAGRLGGVQLAINRPRTSARVLSWATSVD